MAPSQTVRRHAALDGVANKISTLSGDGIILLTYTMSGPLASQFLIDVAYTSSSGPCQKAPHHCNSRKHV